MAGVPSPDPPVGRVAPEAVTPDAVSAGRGVPAPPSGFRRPPPAPPPAQSNRTLYVLGAIGLAAIAIGVANDSIDELTVVKFAVLVPAIILHEISHGAAALAFGDTTAKDAGRLSLNPIRHVDPFGTLILPAMLVLTTGTGFGYAKPVPVNPRRMRSPRNHSLLVSLAGPATNIVLALLTIPVIRYVIAQSPYSAPLWLDALVFFGLLNVVLAVFNLIPIPPLDGSALIERVLPRQWWPGYLRFRQYSMGLLLILILVVPGDPLGHLFQPAAEAWLRLLA